MKFEPLLKAAPFSGARVRPFDGTKQYLSTGDLQGDSLSFVDITFKDKPSRADIAVREGDVLFARMKGTKKVLRVTQELADVIVSTGFAVLRPGEDCDPAYLATYLSTDYFERQKEKYCSGAIQPAVTNSGIEKLQIPLPPLNDQHRIAHLLGKVEGLIAQRKQHLQQLDDLLKSVFLEMFGDIKAKRSAHVWEKPRPYLKASSGKSSGSVKVSKETSFPIYGGNGINGWACEPLYTEPVVIVGRVGQQCGIVHVSKGACWVTDNAIVITISDKERLNATYLATAFQNAPIREKVKQLDLPFINQSMLLDFPIPIPEIGLQNKFAAIVEKVEGIKSRYQQSLTDLEDLYGALSQQAFKGELDLSRVPLPVETTTEGFNHERHENTKSAKEKPGWRYDFDDPLRAFV